MCKFRNVTDEAGIEAVNKIRKPCCTHSRLHTPFLRTNYPDLNMSWRSCSSLVDIGPSYIGRLIWQP